MCNCRACSRTAKLQTNSTPLDQLVVCCWISAMYFCPTCSL